MGYHPPHTEGAGMADEGKTSFWNTLPGAITALAALITSIVGLLGVLQGVGWLRGAHQEQNAGRSVDGSKPPDPTLVATKSDAKAAEADRVVRAPPRPTVLPPRPEFEGCFCHIL
jgi:hypothetical protein